MLFIVLWHAIMKGNNNNNANTHSRAISIGPQKQLHSTTGGWIRVAPQLFPNMTSYFIIAQK